MPRRRIPLAVALAGCTVFLLVTMIMGVAGVPARTQVAARERDQGAAAWLAGGRVRRADGRGCDAGCLGGPGAEDLGADAGSLDTARGQGSGYISHERGGSAQVGVGVAGQVQGGQDASLLEFAEACDVPVRWSCRTGVCHTCETTVMSGTVSYAPAPVDDPADGSVLICCSQPRDNLVLDL